MTKILPSSHFISLKFSPISLKCAQNYRIWMLLFIELDMIDPEFIFCITFM